MVTVIREACPHCGGDLELIEGSESVLVCEDGDFAVDAVLAGLMLAAIKQDRSSAAA